MLSPPSSGDAQPTSRVSCDGFPWLVREAHPDVGRRETPDNVSVVGRALAGP